MKREFRVVRRFKGQLIDPTGKHVIDHVDAAELEAVSKPLWRDSIPVIRLPGPTKKKT